MKQKLLRSLTLIVAAIISITSACAAEKNPKHATLIPTHLKKVIAVSDFKMENVAYGADVAMNLGDMLVNKLVKTGRFIVVERDRNSRDLTLAKSAEREQAAKQSGRSIGSGAEAGKAMAAQALFVGVLSGMGRGSSVGGAGIGWGGGGFGAGGMSADSNRVSLIVRWYDTTSLAVLGSEECSKSRADIGFLGLGMGAGGFGMGGGTLRTPLDKAISQAMDRCVRWIVTNMESVPWEGQVIKSNGSQIYVNAGSDAGVAVGDIFTVYRAGEDLTDPSSGRVLGKSEQSAGTIQITEARQSFSIATSLKGESFSRGDIIRPASNNN